MEEPIRTDNDVQPQPQPMSAEARQEVQDFLSVLLRTTQRPVVGLGLIGLCVLVFLVMVFAGTNPLSPTSDSLIRWGGNFGRLTIRGESWRLFTCMFVHAGIMHLGFNMWVLYKTFPFVERFFGRLAFAGVYFLSGLGGSIASLYFHPLNVSVGASGAIFGVFGGLIGFLVIRHSGFPMTVLQMLQRFAIFFVGMNLLIGFTIPVIDNAAHIGGLLTGLIAGLVLQRPIPPKEGGFQSVLVPVKIAVMASVLWGVYQYAEGEIRSRPAVDFFIFSEHIQPVTKAFDQSSEEVNELLQRLTRTEELQEPVGIQRLLEASEQMVAKVEQAPVETQPIRELKKQLQAAVSGRKQTLEKLQSFLETGDAQQFVGEGGVMSLVEATNDATAKFAESHEELGRELVKK